MSQETDNILRKSLDDVDRINKAQTVAFAILFCVMAGMLSWLACICVNPAIDVRKVILLAVAVLFIAMVYVAMALGMVQSKMTLKVLKAIELSSRRNIVAVASEARTEASGGSVG
jgi:uncharacterized membrane protein